MLNERDGHIDADYGDTSQMMEVLAERLQGDGADVSEVEARLLGSVAALAFESDEKRAKVVHKVMKRKNK